MTTPLLKDGVLLPIQGAGRPTRYKLKDGTVVPGVTTITGRFKEAGGLMFWAWQQGMDGKDFREARDEAGDIGKQAHAMIEAAIHGQPVLVESFATTSPAAVEAYNAFLRWREQTKIDIVGTEIPLVSEVHRFGGTLDALGKMDERLVLLDWKSSNSVHPEYLAQIGAYTLLVEELLEVGPVEEVHLVRIGKEDGSFHHHAWRRITLEEARAAFLLMRQLYDRLAVLKKATA